MDIYQTVPYTYFIQWEDGTKYIGSRYAKNCHPSEFFTEGGYFTSSQYVQEKIKTHGLPQIRMILSTWLTPKESYEHETLLLECFDASNDPTFLNKHNNIFPYINLTDPDVNKKIKDGVRRFIDENPEIRQQAAIKIVESRRNKGKPWHSEEAKKNIGKNNKSGTEEVRKKLRDANLGKKNPEHSKRMSEKTGLNNKKTRVFEVTNPSGETTSIIGCAALSVFCKSNDLAFGQFFQHVNEGKIVKIKAQKPRPEMRNCLGWELKEIDRTT